MRCVLSMRRRRGVYASSILSRWPALFSHSSSEFRACVSVRKQPCGCFCSMNSWCVRDRSWRHASGSRRTTCSSPTGRYGRRRVLLISAGTLCSLSLTRESEKEGAHPLEGELSAVGLIARPGRFRMEVASRSVGNRERERTCGSTYWCVCVRVQRQHRSSEWDFPFT